MKYDLQIHHRRSIRLKGYDYSQAGVYFITICCHNRTLRFGTVVVDHDSMDAQMLLNDFGHIACNEWMKLPERFLNVSLDVFQILPNHMHGIIVLTNVGAGLAPALDNAGVDNVGVDNRVGARPAPDNTGIAHNALDYTSIDNISLDRAWASPAPTVASIGTIVGAYKSLVANGCLDLFKGSVETGVISENEMMGKLWQRNYHEHIIRNEDAYQKISDYIINNPGNWNEDKFFKT